MLRKISFCLTLATVVLVMVSFRSLPDSNAPRALRTIVIDPGHGGSDVGAVGTFSKEKDICLAVGLKVGDLMKKELPDVKLIFTRTNDVYPELRARANMANEARAELFVSIHVNAAPPIRKSEFIGYKTQTYWKNKKKYTRKVKNYRTTSTPNPAKGTETYIWGAHKAEDKEVALRENAPMMMEENYQQKYGDIDPNSSDFIMLSSLKTKQYFRRSALLAQHVEEEFRKVGRASRDIKQRQVGIWVLQATAMPSILVETGYITNKEEEEYLNSELGQQEIAQCIVTAIKRYKVELESNQAGSSMEGSAPIRNDPPPPPPSNGKEAILREN